jgi:hypothetical protein
MMGPEAQTLTPAELRQVCDGGHCGALGTQMMWQTSSTMHVVPGVHAANCPFAEMPQCPPATLI